MDEQSLAIRRKLSRLLHEGNEQEFFDVYSSSELGRQVFPWLAAAAHAGRVTMVDRLLHNGRDPNERFFGSTASPAICCACGEGHINVVERLLDAEALISVDNIDDNCLFAAIYARSLPIAKLLIEAGIDIHKTYDLGNGRLKNALSYTVERGAKDIADYLRSLGATMPGAKAEDTVAKQRQFMIDRVGKFLGGAKVETLERVHAEEIDFKYELMFADAMNGFPFITIFTLGLSNRAVYTPGFEQKNSFVELMVHIPLTWDIRVKVFQRPEFQWPIYRIKQMAEYIIGEGVCLEDKHVIISNDEPPQPLGPKTKQSCLMLLADFYDFCPLDLGNTKLVHFYHLVPLYVEERDFEKTKGFMPLLEAMSKTRDSLVVRPDRKPFV